MPALRPLSCIDVDFLLAGGVDRQLLQHLAVIGADHTLERKAARGIGRRIALPHRSDRRHVAVGIGRPQHHFPGGGGHFEGDRVFEPKLLVIVEFAFQDEQLEQQRPVALASFQRLSVLVVDGLLEQRRKIVEAVEPERNLFLAQALQHDGQQLGFLGEHALDLAEIDAAGAHRLGKGFQFVDFAQQCAVGRRGHREKILALAFLLAARIGVIERFGPHRRRAFELDREQHRQCVEFLAVVGELVKIEQHQPGADAALALGRLEVIFQRFLCRIVAVGCIQDGRFVDRRQVAGIRG
ncbi:MAG: hypothetical protein HY255_10245 [Betaproteobacteria bacterium]|nr:hypothetical protein [Betaproteobacteria bacterium]